MKKVRRKSALCRSFAANLEAEREARGLSQEALAQEAGLHRAYVSSVESGERSGSRIFIDEIERLAWALGVEPANLVRR
jgi:transcriptional regulator with XRE-family HTH domain